MLPCWGPGAKPLAGRGAEPRGARWEARAALYPATLHNRRYVKCLGAVFRTSRGCATLRHSGLLCDVPVFRASARGTVCWGCRGAMIRTRRAACTRVRARVRSRKAPRAGGSGGGKPTELFWMTSARPGVGPGRARMRTRLRARAGPSAWARACL